jgi:hypothetical protein
VGLIIIKRDKNEDVVIAITLFKKTYWFRKRLKRLVKKINDPVEGITLYFGRNIHVYHSWSPD